MPGRAVRHLDARPLGDAVGVEILSVDVSSIPDETTIDATRCWRLLYRTIIAEHLAAIRGSTIRYRSQDEIDLMHRFAEQIIYPDRPESVMVAGGS